MASFNSAFTSANNTTGSGDTSTPSKSLTAGQHVLVAVWNYNTAPTTGSVVYVKDGGSEVNLTLVRSYTRSGNSDRAAFFFLRNAAAGSYVIRAKSLPYVVVSAIVIDAKANCVVASTSNSGGAGEGSATGLNLSSPSLAPTFASSVAFGLMTHNTDGSATPSDSALDANTGAGWTLVHEQEDYDGASQPGASQYKDLASTSSVTSTFSIAVATTAYLSQLCIVSDTPSVWQTLGNGGLGYVDNLEADTIVPTATILPGSLVIIPMGMYAYNPDPSWITDDGGHTWAIGSPNGQQDFIAAEDSGTNGSATQFYALATSPITSISIDTSGAVSGDPDAAEWWRWGIIVVEDPYTTALVGAGIKGTQANVTDVTAGTITPTRTRSLIVICFTNRGHEVDHNPLSFSSGFSLTNGYAGTENSAHAAGSWFWYEDEVGDPLTPTVTFSASTGKTRVTTLSWNRTGGSPVSSGGQPAMKRFGGVPFSAVLSTQDGVWIF